MAKESPVAGDDGIEARGKDRLDRWCAVLAHAYPHEDASDWDQVGLHVGDPQRDLVSRVLVSLDVTEMVLDEAAELGANLVIAHHPLLFSPLKRLTPQTAAGRIALRAARQGCAVLAAHTNVDRAVDGTSHPAADVLGLVERRPITPAEPGSETEAGTPPGGGPSKGMGLIGTLTEPLTITEVARRLADGLPCPTLRLATHDPTHMIRTVGIAGGAGDSMIPALLPDGAQPLVDVFVTGDLKHHPTLDALAMGLSLIDAGHFGTENQAMDAVVNNLRSLKDSYGLRAPIHRSQVNTDPWIDYRHPPSKERIT